MATLNINPDVTDDMFYRYKMPRLVAKVEGKGNGIKTVVPNMVAIATSLSRPPSYPTKYFGIELGAQTQMDPKTERYIVNGCHEAVKLQELLFGFIRKFVLCKECGNPETDISVHKGSIAAACKACGKNYVIETVHKLGQYITKNPPGEEGVAKESKTKSRRKKKDEEQDQSPTHENGPTDGELVDPENNNLKDKDSGNDSDDWDDDDWEGVDEEATTDAPGGEKDNGVELISAGAGHLFIDKDTYLPESERGDIFYQFVKRMVSEDRAALSTAEARIKISDEAKRLEVHDKAVMVLAELLFTEDMVKECKLYRGLFLTFTHENDKAQRYLLGAYESILGGKELGKTLMPKAAHVLKALYDNDIVTEEAIFKWAEKPSKKYVPKEVSADIHQRVAKVVEWLREADEESSSDDEGNDEDEDDEDEEEEEAPVHSKAMPAVPKQQVIVDDAGDEVDIDDI